jgi:Carboxypeptidase regulatory-like domain
MQPPTSLITGTVERARRPNLLVGEPAGPPVPRATVEALDETKVVATATTDDASRYELQVHPGTYLIRMAAGGRGQMVTIAAGEAMTVRFVLDTPMIR